jgi:hypothetical protein
MCSNRTRAIPMIGMALISLTAFAISAGNTPGENFPIMETSYNLQSFDSSGTPDVVSVTNSLQDTYFYSNCYNTTHTYSNVPCGATIFKTPSGLGSTPNSEFPRVELRATRDFFNGDNFTNTQTGTAYIIQNPSTDSIIFAQIHGEKPGGSEMLKLRWENGAIKAGVKIHYGDTESISTLVSGVKLKDPINYTLQAVGTSTAINVTINVIVDGTTHSQTYTYPASSWSGIGLYFKAGDYNQDSSADGTEAVVAYSALNVTYN